MPAKKKTSKSTPPDSPDAPNRMAEVAMEVAILLGRKRVPIETLLNWTEGSLIELGTKWVRDSKHRAFTVVDVQVNGRPFAEGEVVTVGENFGVRLTEVVNRDVG